jgi:type IV secretion system protein TrbL
MYKLSGKFKYLVAAVIGLLFNAVVYAADSAPLLVNCDVTYNSTAGVGSSAFFDSIVKAFYGATGGISGGTGWLTRANSIASHIFLSLVVIEITWTAIHWLLRKNEIGDLIVSMFFKIMSVTFMYWIAVTLVPQWIPMLLQGFLQIATGISNVDLAKLQGIDVQGYLSPSGIMSVGMCNADNLAAMSTLWSDSNIATQLLYSLMTVFTIFFVLVSFLVVTLQLLMTEIESFIVLFGGAAMLGFTGSRWTLPWGEKYFGYAVSVGVKLLVIYLIVAVGNKVVSHELNDIVHNAMNAVGATANDSPPSIKEYLRLVVISLIYAGLAWNVPGMAGTFLNGNPNMSLGTMSGAAMATGAVMAGGAAGLASTPGTVKAAGESAVGAVKGAIDTASAGYQRLAAMGQKAFGGGSSGGSPPIPSSPPSSPSPSSGAGGGAAGGSAGGAGGSTAGGGSGGNAAGGGTTGGGSAGSGAGSSAGGDTGSNAGGEGGNGTGGDAGGGPSKPFSLRFAGNSSGGATGTGDENAIGGAAKANAAPTAQQLDKLTGAIDRLAANQGKPAPYHARAGEYAKQKLSGAAQHLKSSDGQTGSVSIRFNHPTD